MLEKFDACNFFLNRHQNIINTGTRSKCDCICHGIAIKKSANEVARIWLRFKWTQIWCALNCCNVSDIITPFYTTIIIIKLESWPTAFFSLFCCPLYHPHSCSQSWVWVMVRLPITFPHLYAHQQICFVCFAISNTKIKVYYSKMFGVRVVTDRICLPGHSVCRCDCIPLCGTFKYFCHV